MNLTIGNWRFSPGLVTSLLAVIFVVLFTRLGLWQLDRAEYKSDRFNEYNTRQTAAPLNLNQYGKAMLAGDVLWRRAMVTGRFREDVQFLLDNRVYKSRQGYFVYTPFEVEDSDMLMLVNRGWVDANRDRARIPELLRSVGPVTISGRLKQEPKTGILLKDAAPEQMSEQVFRVQEIKLDKLQDFSGLALAPVILRLGPESGHGYVRDWPVPGSDEKKHLGYAFQWFAFAAVLALIYLVMNVKKINTADNEQ